MASLSSFNDKTPIDKDFTLGPEKFTQFDCKLHEIKTLLEDLEPKLKNLTPAEITTNLKVLEKFAEELERIKNEDKGGSFTVRIQMNESRIRKIMQTIEGINDGISHTIMEVKTHLNRLFTFDEGDLLQSII